MITRDSADTRMRCAKSESSRRACIRARPKRGRKADGASQCKVTVLQCLLHVRLREPLLNLLVNWPRLQLLLCDAVGHFCRICLTVRPNEAFSGNGHRIHVCRKCAALPKLEREAIEQEQEIFGFLQQSHISAKNIARLTTLSSSSNARIAELAGIVIEVAKVKPHKRHRLRVLAKERRDFLLKLEQTGLIFAHHYA